MNTVQKIQHSLSASGAIDGAISFPTLLIENSRATKTTLAAADQALEYFRRSGLSGYRSTRNQRGYGMVIRSLNSEPPWVESIKMGEEMSPERETQLRPLTIHVHETSDEVLFELMHQNLLKRDADMGLGQPLDNVCRELGQPTRLDEFMSLVALARLLGPAVAYDLEQLILYEFGVDSSGFQVGAGAPDLFLWASNGECKFWFFSEVKAPGDYLTANQKSWLPQHWEVVQGHFLLTILA
jgi:hypothetical protein